MIGTILLAVLGLSFLIFIHELGHYVVARRQGMRVEVFSIGFGKPLISWMHKGVKWQICAGLFGGYVKITGMENSDDKSPGSFYAKSPWARIKVAFMGPLVNIVFAIMVFTGIWLAGGRTKHFEEHTKIIGWVDPGSELAEKGVGPGDTILAYNGKPFQGFMDILQQGVLKQESIEVQGEKVDYFTQGKTEYSYQLRPYSSEGFVHKEVKTVGVLNLASSLIFHGYKPGYEKVSPLRNSGIQNQDRVVWVNGEVVFSREQLSHIINQNSVYATVIRDGQRIGVRIPRISIDELLLTEEQKGDFLDWRREIVSMAKEDYFIPYNINSSGEVLGKIPLIDQETYFTTAKNYHVDGIDVDLKLGDKITSIGGTPVESSLDIFKHLAEKKALMIVQGGDSAAPVTWKEQDALFTNRVDWTSLQHVINNIGVDNASTSDHSIKLLQPISPMSLDAFKHSLTEEQQKELPALSSKDLQKEYLLLGANIQPVRVVYNPNPLQMCKDVICEIGHILSSLFTGNLSPKWMSGPVGIIKGMSDSLHVNYLEGFYLLGMISLNLGIINLLPIPVLDGGHICFSLFEKITRRRISSKTMDRMILPFFMILIAFFIYLTFHDITRLFGK